MTSVRCAFCARSLPPGSLRYVLMWKMFADYDGIINIEDEASLERTMMDVEAESPADLEDQIYMESRHILCSSCREEIIDTLATLDNQNEACEAEEKDGTGEGNLH